MENDLDLKMPIGTNPIQDLKKEMNADEKVVSYQMIESAEKIGEILFENAEFILWFSKDSNLSKR